MAAAFSSTILDNPDGVRFASGTFTPDNSYTTGGYAVTPATFGFSSRIFAVLLTVRGAAVNAPVWTFDRTNSKLKAHGTAASASGLTEIAAAVDLSAAGQVVEFFAIGV